MKIGTHGKDDEPNRSPVPGGATQNDSKHHLAYLVGN